MPTSRNIITNGRCSGCGTGDYVRTGNGTTYCSYCEVQCPSCQEWRHYNTSRCENCTEMCTTCRRWRMNNDFTEHHGTRMCTNCMAAHHVCGGCGQERKSNVDSMVTTRDTHEWRCYDHCSYYCDDCGQYHANPCAVVRLGAPRNCGGYHHTRPAMWLGGPLPRDGRGRQEGYYVGFELEVTASRSDNCETLTAWSEKRLGVNIFDCKTDSTVAGFEIATQPMTPEFFERVPWDDFFEMMNSEFHTPDDDGWDEPHTHGLHVHIGKVAFRTDANIAAYSYLLNQGDHLER